ncbi:hypothetical protein [Intrasporangium calvum]|uniref:hypothetical protein n=1 Tax=Intrasporangium calvum TaxID=53358 RepID=UPI0002F13ED4|nr:hypothetical protein [Intrasporangium calvum]
MTRLRGRLCLACTAWRYAHPGAGECICCHRELAVNQHQACRLCWAQTFTRQAQLGLPRDVLSANQAGQQLWFANMTNPRNGYRPHPRRDYRRPRDQRHPVEEDPTAGEPAAPTAPGPGQLDLFAYHPIEDPARRYGFGDPPSSRFAALLDQLTLEHAARYGWTTRQTKETRITLRVLQARSRLYGPPVRATDVQQLIEDGLRVRLPMAVLTEADLLFDDRPPRLVTWFTRQLHGLPEAMASELQTWFEVLHHGSTVPPRSHPRSEGTIRTRTLWAMPTLRAWAADGHHSLREITRSDILAVLPGEGTPRATLGAALRSIFTTLKGHRLLFVNPTARIRVGTLERRTPMPIATAAIRAAFDSDDPATAAITTLIGIHGLRPREACALHLFEVRDNRITLPDRSILLAPATKARLDRYLAYRRERWPGCINPHFLIHARSAATPEQVRVPWLTDKLGMSADALRQDRILAEANAGSDLRRICDFFGVTIETAEHYARTVSHPDLDAFTTDPAGSRTDTPQ